MMKRNSWPAWILVATSLCAAAPVQAYEQDMKNLAADLSVGIQGAKRTRVTVLDFVDLDKKTTNLGKFLAQQLAAAFAEGGKVEVVDQSQLPQLFDQIAKLSDGLIDPATKQELGQVTSTEVVVVATVIPSSLTVRIEAKAIDLPTAKVLAARSAKVARLGGIVERLASESEGGGTSLGGTPGVMTAQPLIQKTPPPSVLTRSDLGVLFELDECVLENGVLSCTLTMTSSTKNRMVMIGLGSRVWDESGAEYGAATVQIANSSSEDGCVRKEVLKGVPTRASLTFHEFPEESEVVQQLRIWWSDTNGSWCSNANRAVNFERIPLTESAVASHGGLGKSSQKRGASPAAKKGGILGRIGSRVLEMVEDAAMSRIEQETDKVLGTDDEEQVTPKKPKKPKKPAVDEE
jgi:FlgO protein